LGVSRQDNGGSDEEAPAAVSMRLVTYRSHVRFMAFLPLAAAFLLAAVMPDVSLWWRAGFLVMGSLNVVQLGQYLCCVRRWSRVEGVLNVPTFRHPERSFRVPSGLSLELVELFFAMTIHVGTAYAGSTQQLAINVCVSRRDVRRWVRDGS
jgi:hypothetical protein